MKFDVKGMAEQMNDAFDGSKDQEKAAAATGKTAGKQSKGHKEKQPLAITAGNSADLGKKQLQFYN